MASPHPPIPLLSLRPPTFLLGSRKARPFHLCHEANTSFHFCHPPFPGMTCCEEALLFIRTSVCPRDHPYGIYVFSLFVIFSGICIPTSPETTIHSSMCLEPTHPACSLKREGHLCYNTKMVTFIEARTRSPR